LFDLWFFADDTETAKECLERLEHLENAFLKPRLHERVYTSRQKTDQIFAAFRPIFAAFRPIF
jgi:hypothetical protein